MNLIESGNVNYGPSDFFVHQRVNTIYINKDAQRFKRELNIWFKRSIKTTLRYKHRQRNHNKKKCLLCPVHRKRGTECSVLHEHLAGLQASKMKMTWTASGEAKRKTMGICHCCLCYSIFFRVGFMILKISILKNVKLVV